MALSAQGQKFCKVFYYENEKVDIRRVHEIKVLAADARVHWIVGDDLPDTIMLQSGISYRGAHRLTVFMNPEKAKASPVFAESSGWVTQRDVYFAVMGVMLFKVVTAFAHATAYSLSY